MLAGSARYRQGLLRAFTSCMNAVLHHKSIATIHVGMFAHRILLYDDCSSFGIESLVGSKRSVGWMFDCRACLDKFWMYLWARVCDRGGSCHRVFLTYTFRYC